MQMQMNANEILTQASRLGAMAALMVCPKMRINRVLICYSLPKHVFKQLKFHEKIHAK